MVKIQSQIEDAIKVIKSSNVYLREIETRVTNNSITKLEVGDDLLLGEKPRYKNREFSILFPLFTIVDLITNGIIPKKANSKYQKKWACLPDSSTDQKIFKECYRILRIIRNFAVHSSQSILETSENYIMFENRSNPETKDAKILLSKDGLDYLATYVIAYASEKDKRYTEKHRNEILKSYYSEFRKGLIEFEDSDLKDNPLLTLEKIDAYFKILVRYYIENASFKFTNTSKNIEITSGLPEKIDFGLNSNELQRVETIQKRYSRDYLIQVANMGNKKYLIPDEELNPKHEISVTNMKVYQLDLDD